MMTPTNKNTGDYSPKLRYVQINLKHSIEASDNLIFFMITNNIDIAFVQEPWTSDTKVKGLTHQNYKTLFKETESRPRACLIASNHLKIHLMPNFSDADTTVAKVEWGKNNITLVSSYMAHDHPAPPKSISDLMKIKKNCKGSGLLIGCDANARHRLWGNEKTNDRGESFLDFINDNNLVIINKGSEPTFVFPSSANWEGWDAILDLTLTNNSDLKIDKWRVSKENSFSDHKMILFESNFVTIPEEPFRNPRNTDWLGFEAITRQNLSQVVHGECSKQSIEATVKALENCYESAFSRTCKVKRGRKKNLPKYFTKELLDLRKKLRKQHNLSYRTGDWETYNIMLGLYNKSKRNAKGEAWRNHTESIDTTEGASKLRKQMTRVQPTPSFLMKPNGQWTETSQESNVILLETHFPGCTTNEIHTDAASNLGMSMENLESIVSEEKIIWAIQSFEPYKSAGLDGIIPKMLQLSIKEITPLLVRVYKDCLKIGYVPESWRKVKVIFIPKPGKIGHSVAKDYRPISLTSFLLKTFERIIDLHIRSSFKDNNISKAQHAYMKGRSTETALHALLGHAEKAIEHKQMALTAFLDIEGAFNNVTAMAIKAALVSINTDPSIVQWIMQMLNTRVIQSTVGSDTTIKYACRGTPQGGVLSPLLWLLVVNSILLKFDHTESKIVAYADDLAITIIGDDLPTIKNKMQITLGKICLWAESCGLNINPKKTEILLFTRKKIEFGTISLQGVKIKKSNSAKFLGVIFTPTLSWRLQVEERAKKAQAAFYACRSSFGKTWGLSPKLTHWIYTAIVRPILLYGVVIWWKALEIDDYIDILSKVQRNVALGSTGALGSTPAAALDIFLGMSPIKLFAKEVVFKTAARLKAINSWSDKDYGHSIITRKIPFRVGKNSDHIITETNFGKNYKVIYPSREEWTTAGPPVNADITIYTDGSKTEEGNGAGVWSQWANTSYSYKLPTFATVFQSEIFAIMMACELIKTSETIGNRIIICVDSQAALKALESCFVKSSIVRRCVTLLKEISNSNHVILTWVPGHSNIIGNDYADMLARQGSEKHVSWTTQIECPLAATFFGISKYMKNKWQKSWTQIETCKVSRTIWPEINQKATQMLLNMNRAKLRISIHALTGHWNIGRHAERRGTNTVEGCKGCGIPNKDLDAFHFWCDCPSLALSRLEIFNNTTLKELPSITKFKLEKHIEFIKRAKWL